MTLKKLQRKIINECYEKTKKIISENRDLLKLIAEALLEKETITKEEIDYLVKNGTLPDEDKEVDASDFEELSINDLDLEELREFALEKGIENANELEKEELIKLLSE